MARFFSIQLNDLVVEEMCECGHLKREHGSTLTKLSSSISVRNPHGGNCCARHCKCARFIWSRWVTATEMEESITEAQKEEFATED
jgi:hypothetical protein